MQRLDRINIHLKHVRVLKSRHHTMHTPLKLYIGYRHKLVVALIT